MNPHKLRLARALHSVRADSALIDLQRRLNSPYIRAVNYHDVPPNRAADFERQLRFYSRHFAPVDHADLVALGNGEWKKPKPGLILSFDDGARSHADVVAPLLEKHGFVGWFMVPGGFIDAAPEDQREYAQVHSIKHDNYDYQDRRIAMTWADLRHLSTHHVVGCHTWDHVRLSGELSQSKLEIQINKAKEWLEDRIETEVPVFAWVGGEERSYSRAAAEAIAGAGYSHSFMTNSRVIQPKTPRLQLQRTNIEASDPDVVMRFQLTGVMDLLYTAKRRRVNHLTTP